MEVAVIGGGAVGLLFAHYLEKSGADVTVYVRRGKQVEALRKNGLTLIRQGNFCRTKPSAKRLKPPGEIKADLVIVAVKQYDLPELTPVLEHSVSQKSKLLFVQNGMGHVKLMQRLTHPQIFVGVVEHGVLKKSDCEIEHTGLGVVKLAAFRGSHEVLAPIRDRLEHSLFPIEFRQDWYTLMAEKLLVNACINPLTALYRVENGELIHNSRFRQTMKRLFDEAFGVIELENEESYWQNVQNVCCNTAKNRSSMLRDIETGRRTEIDAISGYLLKQAKQKKQWLPYTTFVYDSIKGMEHPKQENHSNHETVNRDKNSRK